MLRYLRLVCLSTAISVSISVFAKTEGTWVNHSSFDGQSVCILPSSYRCHFLLQSAYYRTDMPSDLRRPSARLYLCDLTEKERKIVPVPQNPGKPLQSVSLARVSPYDGTLVAVYSDGDISIHPKYGEPTFISSPFSKSVTPGSSKPLSINCPPDPEEVWLSTERGVTAIDTRRGQVTRTIPFSEKISSALRCGNHILIVCGDRLLAATDTEKITFTDFKDAVTDRDLAGLEMILPMKGNLALTVERLQGSRFRISLLIPDKATPFSSPSRLVTLTETNLDTQGVRTLSHQLEANLIPTPDGYSLRNGSSLTHIGYTLSDEPSSLSDEEIRSIILNKTPPAYPSWKSAGRKGFILSDGDAPPGTIRPETSSAFICSTIAYAPGHGLVAANHGSSLDFTYASASLPPIFSILSSGHWSLPSPPYNIPESFGVNADTYPVTLPNGMAVDPADPDILWCGSITCGLARFDLSSPQTPNLHLSNGADPWRKKEGFIEIAPVQKNWNRLVKFSEPTFDANGNLWTAWHNHDACLDGDPHAELWMLPREIQDAAGELPPPRSLSEGWIKISLPTGDEEPTNNETLLALAAPGNRGLIVYSTNIFTPAIHVYDHRDTPADPSDDITASFTDPVDSLQRKIGCNHVRRIREDLSSGLVWVATEAGLFRFDPHEILKGSLQVTPMGSKEDGGISLRGIAVSDMAFDLDRNVVWIATLGAGLWRLDSMTGKVTDIFSTENSPIPSDNLYAVGHNPEEGNILVSTDEGLAEFIPRDTPGFTLHTPMSVTPAVITPDYKGPVTIHSAGVNAEILVKDRDGNTVSALKADQSGSLCIETDSLCSDGRSRFLTIEVPEHGKSTELILLTP